MRFSFYLIILAAVASMAVSSASACDQPQADNPETPAVAVDAQVPVGADGTKVFIDEQTGKVTSAPSEAQRAAMKALVDNMLSQSDEGLYDEYLANGAVLRSLQGRFQSATVVRIDSDGAQHMECTTTLIDSGDHDAKKPAKTEPATGSVK